MNVKYSDGWTPLLWAAREGHETIVQRLIAAEASVNARSNAGTTPLMFAVRGGHHTVVGILEQ